RDNPVRREISRIECPSRRCQRRITLSNAMSITPNSPALIKQGQVQTWVTSRWKNPSIPGQLSAEINNSALPLSFLIAATRPIGFGDRQLAGVVVGLYLPSRIAGCARGHRSASVSLATSAARPSTPTPSTPAAMQYSTCLFIAAQFRIQLGYFQLT